MTRTHHEGGNVYSKRVFDYCKKTDNLPIEGLAQKGALKNPDKFGQSNYQAAYGQIH
jgi:hypothetical protein